MDLTDPARFVQICSHLLHICPPGPRTSRCLEGSPFDSQASAEMPPVSPGGIRSGTGENGIEISGCRSVGDRTGTVKADLKSENLLH